ncbi:uncharacterized protein LOC109716357 [Ananas comosus]|uniref:Hypoxanthine phosphoribosyltransferase n=1 Tax=Ananas comosus TaxID=4615 RepID=A0A6P5FV25_ANACO|nr:uncharacterized protein LOC109716357 [Ananas comosus]
MTFHAPSLALTFPPPFITPFPCRLARIKTPLITINSPNPNPRNPRNRPLLFSSSPSPSSMGSEAEIERVLWTEEEIARRVAELGAAISADFKGAVPSPVVLVGVATGAFLFLADIAREITVPVAIDFVRAESYGAGTESSGEPRISGDLKIDVEGKHVIIVEDIVDTGNTLSRLMSHLEKKGPLSVSLCTFLDKPARRRVNFELVGEGKFYRGFECPDYFVVGYGMDYAELYRNLPYVGILKPEMYK